MTNVEIWKDVIGYEGFYQVSNLGSVRSVDRTIHCADGRTRHFKGKIRKVHVNPSGYPCVNLRKRNSNHLCTVHKLVAEAFLGKRPEGYHTDHIDRDRENSTLANLRYIPHYENEAQGAEKQRTPVAQYTLDGVFVNEYVGINEAARQTGISAADICNCKNGKRSQAGGYRWESAS